VAETLSPAVVSELIADFIVAGSVAALELRAVTSPEEPSPVAVAAPDLPAQLTVYLDLLLRWNARTNLTAIREPREIVRRHFGESLFAGVVLSAVLPEHASLLDLGSGAGFPGLPIQLLRPDLRVTMAESQGKKAAFLREAVRTLGLKTEVFGARVETMPASRSFDAVTLRAVDNMERAIQLAAGRVCTGGWLAILGEAGEMSKATLRIPTPGRQNSFLEISRR
jgi:16S rRNA (guanine527-N7)-methyltransferase